MYIVCMEGGDPKHSTITGIGTRYYMICNTAYHCLPLPTTTSIATNEALPQQQHQARSYKDQKLEGYEEEISPHGLLGMALLYPRPKR